MMTSEAELKPALTGTGQKPLPPTAFVTSWHWGPYWPHPLQVEV